MSTRVEALRAEGPGGPPPRSVGLTDRRGERDALERLIEAVRGGRGQALLVRGEAGIGKTALLDHLVAHARGIRVLRAAGVSSEAGLAFAGLHQLCLPLLDHLPDLLVPQRDALGTALGVGAGAPPDPFLVGLAALSLLSEVAAGERPLLCVVDDEQWLDHPSAQALGFVARRLGAVPVGLVVATRASGHDMAGLPEILVEGLPEEDARSLLAEAFPCPLDERARDLIVAETHGNPAALLELPRTWSPFELAGGFGLPRVAPATGWIDDGVHRRLAVLPPPTRRLLELAAADPSGDPVLVQRAARRLGLPTQAAAPAIEAGLVELGPQVRFRHPLVRSVAYRTASEQHRHAVHAALAEATDAVADADRRAWHRAEAAEATDEDIATDLDDAAERARERGGLAAAAAFRERSVFLTPDPTCRVDRVLEAAQANLQAGAYGKALGLLAIAEAGPRDVQGGACLELLRGRIAFASTLGSDAPSLLLKAAGRLEHLDVGLAVRAYAEAWTAASWAGRLAGAGDLQEVARAARALIGSEEPSDPAELVLDGLARFVTDGPTAAAPRLRQAVATLVVGGGTADDGQGVGWPVAALLWDLDAGIAISARQAREARTVGALERLPLALTGLAVHRAWRGDLEAAASLAAEIAAVARVTGCRIAPVAAMQLAALRGDEAGLAALVEAAAAKAATDGQGAAGTSAHWSTAVLHNGQCRYTDALCEAAKAAEDAHPFLSSWVLPELVEAAARAGDTRTATDASARLTETTRAAASDFGLGLAARSRALATRIGAPEADHREAIDRLGRAAAGPDLARSHLLYGEWLRRENRRVDARRQLRTAHEMLDTIGMPAFAERARRELLATGESVRRRGSDTSLSLTCQEASIARLAADGQTNAEIGEQLFLSARTIEWHLRKVFTKLGVGSRRELRRGLYTAATAEQTR